MSSLDLSEISYNTKMNNFPIECLVPVISRDSISEEYLGTPIESLLGYHNLKCPFKTYKHAEMLIGMCMDYRKHLNIPDNFAYILRTGGGNLRYSEFKLSYAIAIGGIKAIALIGHDNCGMVNLMSKKEKFVQGLVENAGWTQERAEDHFTHFVPMFEIGNEVDFVISEAQRLRLRYPKILVAPMFYGMADRQLYLLKE